jgi:hypothetical protein
VTKKKVSDTNAPKAKVKTKPKAKVATSPKPKKKVPEITPEPKVAEINVEQEFPHSEFPYKLVHKDGNETRTCYFMNEVHLNKHLERYRLDKRKVKILCRYDYESNPSK